MLPNVALMALNRCGLWKLPGSEDLLEPIQYQLPIQPATTHLVVHPAAHTPPAGPVDSDRDQAPLLLTERAWYVVKFDNGNFTKDYVCQLLREEEANGVQENVVNSYMGYMSVRTQGLAARERRLFKKCPVEKLFTNANLCFCGCLGHTRISPSSQSYVQAGHWIFL